MKQEIKSVIRKTAKIAAVTCVAASAVAIMTSGVALRAISEGGKYLANTVKKIVNGEDPMIDTVATEADFAAEEAAAEEI